MARYRISYMAYRDCEEATELSRSRASAQFYLGALLPFITLGSVIAFDYLVPSLLYEYFDLGNFFIVLFTIFILPFFNFDIWVKHNIKTSYLCERLIIKKKLHDIDANVLKAILKDKKTKYEKERNELFKSFVVYYYSIILILHGLIAVLQANNKPELLAISIIVIIISLIVVIGFYNYKEGKLDKIILKIKNKTNDCKTQKDNNLQKCETERERENNYCRKCGAPLLSDSKFCSKCGEEII